VTDVASLGFGGAPIGGLYDAVSAESARAALDAAWESGIRYFDTAPLYGSGLSEMRLGTFLAERPRDAFTISTKVGRVLAPPSGDNRSGSLAAFRGGLPFDARFDFSASGVRQSLEASLTRLHLSFVDIALIHDPDEHLDQAIEVSYPELVRLRDEGLVRAIGAGTNSVEAAQRMVRDCDLDVILVAGRYTLLDRTAAETLFPLCTQRGVRVIAAGVYNSGILAKSTLADDARFDYAVAPAGVLARAKRIAAICRRYGVALPEAALAFVFHHPAVWRVVVGMRSAAEVRANVAALKSYIPAALWNQLT